MIDHDLDKWADAMQHQTRPNPVGLTDDLRTAAAAVRLLREMIGVYREDHGDDMSPQSQPDVIARAMKIVGAA